MNAKLRQTAARAKPRRGALAQCARFLTKVNGCAHAALFDRASSFDRMPNLMCPGLRGRLAASGYLAGSRLWTPAQVAMIVEALGEP